ncbi:endogenous retrovirus group PABLB member 1 Env polyprotein-like [Perognathus longimembris pacificus]|uniref:endogenous retrovirus group PABLB member 1 Env polyprotein-like n=1 Tax=Perognathus longimembris pacificus TaxID=214514 RepID=UPI00201887F7|nr:endogenous retrovirus group PABLB member 1 Env polyprotein-like [Perognathus longimembris pacificus]
MSLGLNLPPSSKMSKLRGFFLLLFLPSVHMTSNSFLDWAENYAWQVNQSNCWICGLLPMSSTSGLPWWVSPIQGTDWARLQKFIDEAKTNIQVLSSVTRYNVSEWPIAGTLQQPGHNKSFTLSATIKEALQYMPSQMSGSKASAQILTRTDPNQRSHRYFEGYYQIWDEFIWLTPVIGKLSQKAPLCWEQRNHTLDHWENSTKKVGLIPESNCERIIVLQATDWFASNWTVRHGRPFAVRWAAPNGTKWLCGDNMWPWLPPGWLGRCTIGFPWVQGRWVRTLENPANLPNLKQRWTRSVFKWYDHLAGIIPTVGLEDVMWHIETLTKFTQKALNDTAQGISLLNSEVKMLRQAVLQNRMALDILTAAQGGTCAIIKTECCVYIPDYSANVSQALHDLSSQINSMSDSSWSLNDLLKSWGFDGSWWKKLLFGLAVFVCGGIVLFCALNFICGTCCSLMSRMASFPLRWQGSYCASPERGKAQAELPNSSFDLPVYPSQSFRQDQGPMPA